MDHMSFGNSDSSATKNEMKASKTDNARTERLPNNMKETESRYVYVNEVISF